MDSMDVFESEAGSSSGLASQDILPPSANQPVRNEPEPDVAVENGNDEIRDWLRSISDRLDSMQASSDNPHKPKKRKKARIAEYEYSSTNER